MGDDSIYGNRTVIINSDSCHLSSLCCVLNCGMQVREPDLPVAACASEMSPRKLPAGFRWGSQSPEGVEPGAQSYTQCVQDCLKGHGTEPNCSAPRFTLLLELQWHFTAFDVHVGACQHHLEEKCRM